MTAPAQLAPDAAFVRSHAPSIGLRVHPALPLLVLGSGVVAQQLTDTGIAPIPNCAPWFRGVARHGGRIVPFFDIALWAGVERSGERATMISVVQGEHVLGLLASESPMVVPAETAIRPWMSKTEMLAGPHAASVACRFDPSAWLTEIASSVAWESG